MAANSTLERFRPRVAEERNPLQRPSNRLRLESFMQTSVEEHDELVENAPDTNGSDDPGPPEQPEAPVEEPAVPEVVLLKAIVERLDAILQDTEMRRSEANNRAAAVFGQAAAKVLPSLAFSLFSVELAKATLALANSIPTEKMQLHVSPQHVEPLVEQLSRHSENLSLEIIPDSEIQLGKAELKWADGGAEFDSEKLITQAIDFLNSRLSENEIKGSPDE